MRILIAVLAFMLASVAVKVAAAANIPGVGSCGPREHVDQWFAEAGARSPGYSAMEVRDPQTGEHLGVVEMSFWMDAKGDSAIVVMQMINDPQHGEMPFGCVVMRGSAMQKAPIFVRGKGA